MAQSDNSSASPTRVILIHGTFAGADSEIGSAWWQTEGIFRQSIASSCPGVVSSFQWDIGDNSETARRRFGAKLSALILEMEKEGIPYSFVAHSHGGSVLWHALAESALVCPGLPRLQCWVTVGTPFLQTAPDLTVLFWLVPLIVSLTALSTLAAKHAPTYWALRSDFLLSPDPWVHGAILACALVFMATLSFAGPFLVQALRNAFRERWRSLQLPPTYAALSSRHRIFTSSHDEAFLALTLTLAFGGSLLPTSGYLRPLGRALDEILWRRLTRRAQGCDLPGIRVYRVSAAPADSPCPNSLPAQAEPELEAIANGSIGGASGLIRRSLRNAVFSEPVHQLGDLLDKVDVTDGLIHTSYFREHLTRSLITEEILARRPSEPVQRETQTSHLSSRTGAYLHIGLGACLAVLLYVAYAASGVLLRPLSPIEMVFLELPATSIGDGAFGAPYDSYELFRSLGATGRLSWALPRLGDLQIEKDRALAMAYLSAGLLESGNSIEAKRILYTLPSSPAIRPVMTPGIFGPPATESFADFATLRMLGRLGQFEEARRRIGLRAGSSDWRSVDGSLRHLGYGLVEGGHHGALQVWLPQVTENVRIAIWDRWARNGVPCPAISSLLKMFSAAVQEEARVAAISRHAECHGLSSARDVLLGLRNPALRLKAATRLAFLSRSRDLLSSEVAVFLSRPKDPTAGSAKLLTDAATVLLTLGAQSESRALLDRIETLPPDRVDTTVYQDFSMPDRALLFARLGDIKSALRWWSNSRGLSDYSQEIDAYGLLQRIVAAYSAPSEGFVLPGVSNSQPAAVRIELGRLDQQPLTDAVASGRRLQRAALLATKVYDPEHRSRLNRDIGLAFLRARLPRAAVELSRRCLPQDRVYLLAAVLRWTPQSPSVVVTPLLDPEE